MIFDSKIEINKMETAPRYDIVDSHLHFLDFTQDSDGLEALVEAMDASGVSEAVLFGMPMAKKWDYLMKERPLYDRNRQGRALDGISARDRQVLHAA